MVWPFKSFDQKWCQGIDKYCKSEFIEAPIKIAFRYEQGELASSIKFTYEQRKLAPLIDVIDVKNVINGHVLKEWFDRPWVRTGGTEEEICARIEAIRDGWRGFLKNVKPYP